jgi:hypothetical protein
MVDVMVQLCPRRMELAMLCAMTLLLPIQRAVLRPPPGGGTKLSRLRPIQRPTRGGMELTMGDPMVHRHPVRESFKKSV